MKLLLALLAGLIVTATPALAIEQNCRFIQVRAEREACYQKQEAELAAKRKPEPSADSKDLETMQRMRQEDAEVYRSMRSICRGC
jgi:lauroyl/myristoyl acyltransferase